MPPTVDKEASRAPATLQNKPETVEYRTRARGCSVFTSCVSEVIFAFIKFFGFWDCDCACNAATCVAAAPGDAHRSLLHLHTSFTAVISPDYSHLAEQ